MKPIRRNFVVLYAILAFVLHAWAGAEWKQIDAGLYEGVFNAPETSHTGDSKITVIRIDPRYFDLKLLCAGELDSTNRTVGQWCRDYKLTAAINAGMYAKDYSTHIGYMRNFKYVNSERLRKDYKSMLAFNPVKRAAPPVRLFDAECDNIDDAKSQYSCLVQNIRMISCTQKNVWSKQDKKSSCAALAIDKNGNVLLIFSQSPYAVHDFINFLLKLPLSIQSAMYLEGGAPAALHVTSGNYTLVKNGIYESGNANGTTLSIPQALPNVIGVVKKAKK